MATFLHKSQYADCEPLILGGFGVRSQFEQQQTLLAKFVHPPPSKAYILLWTKKKETTTKPNKTKVPKNVTSPNYLFC
jgi:hypothetical protein